MTLGFLFLGIFMECCFGILLSPLENNDKLKHITKQFVAEWQWESWPIKQELTAQDSQSPGPRINVALWKEPSRSAWYLFGGQPVDSNITKVYSDIWKYSVETRTWKKFFPHTSVIENHGDGQTDGMTAFRSDLLDEITESKKQSKNFKIFLCGDVTKINATKPKKPNLWSTFYKRKKPEEERKEVLKSLAVYVPRTSKPNTVWQMDVKTDLWTAYVCCCNATKNSNENHTSKSFKSAVRKVMQRNGTLQNVNVEKNITHPDNESTVFDSKISKVEDEIDISQQHLSIKNLKKKKKINQHKKGADSAKVKFQKKRNADKVEKKSNNANSEMFLGNETDGTVGDKNDTKVNNINKKEIFNAKLREEQSNQKRKGHIVEKLKSSKSTTEYCPDNLKGGEYVTWCDEKNEALITTDISLSQIILWVFNLRTSHWSKTEAKVSDGVEWSLCSDIKTVRYADTGEEVYLFCTPPDKPSPKISTDIVPQTDKSVRKLVFRLNYKEEVLDSLGEIRLNSYFGTPGGEAVWRNTTKSTLRAVKNSDNETILVLAYSGYVDLWILTGDSQTNEYFDLTDKIWRGSARKWFDKYNAAFYNLQFFSKSGKAETILIRNHRSIPVNEYWGRERGRFIIRIFKNEHLKNQSFENRTREQNLTYELLQSDNKPSGVESQFSPAYSYFIFFGISLVILKIFIFVIFVKRIVEWSRKIKIRSECRKSPLIIRYSVIPDDLLQPVRKD